MTTRRTAAAPNSFIYTGVPMAGPWSGSCGEWDIVAAPHDKQYNLTHGTAGGD